MSISFDSNILLKNLFDLIGTILILSVKMPFLGIIIVPLGLWFFQIQK
jgi:hypothetical protein